MGCRCCIPEIPIPIYQSESDYRDWAFDNGIGTRNGSPCTFGYPTKLLLFVVFFVVVVVYRKCESGMCGE